MIGGKSILVERNRTSQQALRLFVLSPLACNIAEIAQHVGVVRFQSQGVAKSCNGLVILPFRAPRVPQQKIEIGILRKALERLGDAYGPDAADEISAALPV